MKVLKGITASPGIVKGAACLYLEKREEDIPHYGIEAERVEAEVSRLDEALNKAKGSMRQVISASENLFDKRSADIFNAHLLVLEDPVLYNNMAGLIRTRLVNAEHAASDAFEEYIKNYEMSELHFAELAHDIKDVKNRLLAAFGGILGHFECPVGEQQPVIVVSKRLTPSMVINITRRNALAFVTEEGGFTTHATILARGYGVPVIFGVNVTDNINCGDRAIVDGRRGAIFVSPDAATEEAYERKIQDIEKKRAVCEIKKEIPSQTKKGLRVSLKANISAPGEIELLGGLHYDGIGLLRTEFLFVNKDAPPSEEKQYAMYRHVLESAGGKPVVARLLDIASDKMPSYLRLPPQENPDLGIRGARALDLFKDIYITQAKALLRASLHGEMKILYPMISDLNDIRSFRRVLKTARSKLRKEKALFNEDIKEGIMIETPAAAVMAGTLLKHADFANIGSNDLLQYTLAASRGSVSVEKRYHILHPALIRLIEIIVKAGDKTRKEVCLCGEIASFDEYYPLFLSLGLKSFSVAASRLADIKCELMHLEKPPKTLLRKFYNTKTKEEIDKLFKKGGI